MFLWSHSPSSLSWASGLNVATIGNTPVSTTPPELLERTAHCWQPVSRTPVPPLDQGLLRRAHSGPVGPIPRPTPSPSPAAPARMSHLRRPDPAERRRAYKRPNPCPKATSKSAKFPGDLAHDYGSFFFSRFQSFLPPKARRLAPYPLCTVTIASNDRVESVSRETNAPR